MGMPPSTWRNSFYSPLSKKHSWSENEGREEAGAEWVVRGEGGGWDRVGGERGGRRLGQSGW